MTIFGRIVSALAAACLMAACTSSATLVGEPRAWIDVPVNDLDVAPGQPVQIEGHAAHTAGVDHIEFWFDGQLQTTQDKPSTEGSLAYFSQSWTPPSDGDHTIQVVAIGTDGSGSQPDSVRIHVGSQVAEVPQEIPVTPVPTISPSPTVDTPPRVDVTDPPAVAPPPAPVIQFSANPKKVDAGQCTTLTWHVENAQAVAYDGAGVEPDGHSKKLCLCTAQTHTLTVNGLDGSVKTRTVTVNVTGTCVTPEPPPADTTPPGSPKLLKPTNGQEYSCVPSVMLRWQPPTDPSGIAGYRIVVQRHSGDNKWKAAPGVPKNQITATQLELTLECGWYYRWHVQAIDGAGNIGPFSAWFLFTDWLT